MWVRLSGELYRSQVPAGGTVRSVAGTVTSVGGTVTSVGGTVMSVGGTVTSIGGTVTSVGGTVASIGNTVTCAGSIDISTILDTHWFEQTTVDVCVSWSFLCSSMTLNY